MLKTHLKKIIRGFHEAANAIDKYINQLESMGLDIDELSDSSLVLEIVFGIAEDTIQEVLQSPLPARWDLYKGEIK